MKNEKNNLDFENNNKKYNKEKIFHSEYRIEKNMLF